MSESAVEYPALRGKTVDAEKLMVYVFNKHFHTDIGDREGVPVVESLPLDAWIRANAT